MNDPRTRHAVVTGASSGIGAAVARLLAENGYRVALLARRTDHLNQVTEALSGAGHLAIACDLTDEPMLQSAFARVRAEFQSVDLLVNNAGVGYRARVEEMQVELVRRVFDTNVTGMLIACREALPLLRLGQKPVVVNVASVVGRRGIPGQAAYSASKAAVCSIGEALRLEWSKEGIAVCTLNPALTATGFFEAQPNPAGLPRPSLKRAAGAQDVAQRVLDLDKDPKAETSLRWKWRLLGMLSVLSPRLADRTLARRLGGDWVAPQGR